MWDGEFFKMNKVIYEKQVSEVQKNEKVTFQILIYVEKREI